MPSVRERKQSLRVLVVLAAPADLPELDLASERHRLEELFLPLQQAGPAGLLDYTERPATVERLQNMLRAGYDMVHYVGHGTQRMGQGVLLLEKEDGKSHQVLAEEVAILLRGTGIRLVCLNACLTGAERGSLFGGLGPALVQAEIPAVVAMQYAMPDQSALRFTRAFYKHGDRPRAGERRDHRGPHRAAHSTGAWQPGVGLPGLVYPHDRRISVA